METKKKAADSASAAKTARLIRLDDGRMLTHQEIDAECAALEAETAMYSAQAEEAEAETARLTKEIEELKAQNEELRRDMEIERSTTEWIIKAEEGNVEPFPWALQRVTADGPDELNNWLEERFESEARERGKLVELWESGLLILDNAHCAGRLMDLVQDVLMALGVHQLSHDWRSGKWEKAGAGALLGKFYAEIARGVHEFDRVKKDNEGKRDLTHLKPKNVLVKMLRSNPQMQLGYEAELAKHHRDGWAGEAAEAIMKRLWLWHFWRCGPVPSPTLLGGRDGWIHRTCEEFLEPNPLASFHLESPWEVVWAKQDRVMVEASNPDSHQHFRNEWRALWTSERMAALESYQQPRNAEDFANVWAALYLPLIHTFPLPVEPRYRKMKPSKRASSVRTALRVRLDLEADGESS